MSERTLGEVTGAAKSVARTAKAPHEIAAWLKQETIPHFKGDFAGAVDALAMAVTGATYQGSRPGVWSQIIVIDNELPMMGTALAALAIDRGVDIDDPRYNSVPYIPEDYSPKGLN